MSFIQEEESIPLRHRGERSSVVKHRGVDRSEVPLLKTASVGAAASATASVKTHSDSYYLWGTGIAVFIIIAGVIALVVALWETDVIGGSSSSTPAATPPAIVYEYATLSETDVCYSSNTSTLVSFDVFVAGTSLNLTALLASFATATQIAANQLQVCSNYTSGSSGGSRRRLLQYTFGFNASNPIVPIGTGVDIVIQVNTSATPVTITTALVRSFITVSQVHTQEIDVITVTATNIIRSAIKTYK